MRPHVIRTHHEEALHLLQHTAPDQKGCNAYGSGAAHENTRQNADSAQQRGLARQRADAPNCTSTPGPTGAEGTGRGSTELLLTRALPHPTCAHAKPLCGLMMPISGVMLPAEGSSHQARGSTYFAHSTQKHGDDETNNTTAHPRHGTVETNDTSAPEKCTKNAHFSPAKATTVSIPNRYQRAKATTVSNHRATSPAAPRRGARGQRQHLRQPNFARNLSWSFFEMPENVAIPTMQIQCFNES